MNTFIDRQLAKDRYEEMLQDAANARAERKARVVYPNPVTYKFGFALATVLSLALWIVWTFVKG